MVQTALDGSNENTPCVTVVPRSKWETKGFWADLNSDNTRTVFDRAGFNAEQRFVVFAAPEHPGSETWPMQLCEFGFPYHAAEMDLMVSAVTGRRETRVRLTGLLGAAHLNGREGVTCGKVRRCKLKPVEPRVESEKLYGFSARN
jgi:hypothetical protein